ncbi:MAG TPA: sensor histidine kinase, partial [Bacteroidia bacterium]|nr:sensor histidine kinase [Bacteroidia bacterium]
LARFARLIRNVMENSKLEYIPLGQEIETLSLYINLEQLRAGGKFQFNISVDPNVSTFTTLIPPLLLQPFVENSILHGLMPLQDNSGMLKIHIQEHDAMLVCTIEDNGIGRKKAGEIKRHKDPLHRSMGISATEDRINIINSLNPGMAKIIVEDKEEAKGTKVIITIPLKRI